MGTVRISCCSQVYTWRGTSHGDAGSIACDIRGGVYGWKDMGGGNIRTWKEASCPDHEGYGHQRTVLCGRCNGDGTAWDDPCPNCRGTGLVIA